MKTETWKHIGIVARGLAARLVAAREEFGKSAGPALDCNEAGVVSPRGTAAKERRTVRVCVGGETDGAACKTSAGKGAGVQFDKFKIVGGVGAGVRAVPMGSPPQGTALFNSACAAS